MPIRSCTHFSLLFVFFALFLSEFSRAAPSSDCRDFRDSLKNLANPNKDYELRSRLGICLVRSHIDRTEVARTALKIITDPNEDLLLREDLMAAFAESPIRRKIKLEGKLAPALGKQEREAVDRALSGAGSILEAAQAVRTIEETVPVTHLEGDFFRAIVEIANEESNHVLLRAAAVSALERLSVRVVDSGLYDEKNLRLAQETLRSVAAREDNSSYFTDAGSAYRRLAVAGIPGYGRDSGPATRAISSVKAGQAK